MMAMVSAQLCYGIYTFSLYFSEDIHDEYLAKHQFHVKDEHNIQVPVRFNDVVYAAHGLALSTLFSLQWYFYRSKSSAASILPATAATSSSSSSSAAAVRAGAAHGAVSGSLLLAYGGLWCGVAVALLAGHFRLVSMASVVALIGSGKAVISVFKYAPQVAHHRQLKSADEWNLASLLLDLSGATGALTQLLLDAWIAGHVDEITANFPKLMLSCVAIWFNLVFLLQRAILYPKETKT